MTTTLTKAEVIALGDVVEGDLIRSRHEGDWGDYSRVSGTPRRHGGSVILPIFRASGEQSRFVGDADITRVYRKREVTA